MASARPRLRERTDRIRAQGRLHAAIHAVAADLVGPCESASLSPELAAWVDRATEAAASAVTDLAVAALTEILENLMSAAPPDVVARLDEAWSRRVIGVR